MGLLRDVLPDWLPEDQTKADAVRAGLLNFGAAMLQGRGNFGQALGGGIAAGSQGYADTLASQQKQQLQAAQMKQYGLETQKLESEINRPKRLQDILASQGPVGGMPAVSPAGTATAGAPQTQALYQTYLSYGDRLSQAGEVEAAKQYYALAEKLQPKLKEQRALTVNGKRVMANVYDDGATSKVDGFEPDLEKLHFANTGGATIGLDPFTGKPINTIKNTQSPDSVASNAVTIRGQNMVDARSKESNGIAANGRVLDLSTNLRKEFEGLPEVKNYKQALPAFTAIQDAAQRNTPQSDINLVYGIAKLYDPNSVVREGEYATVANSPNIPERVKGYAQYLAGGGKLSPATKAQILAEAKGRIGSYENEYTKVRDDYTSIANRSGADKAQLFPSRLAPVTGAPQPGMVQGGYVFKGGNPADKNNWVKR